MKYQYESKGNYLSFAEDSSKDNSLILAFLGVYKKGVKLDELQEFFYTKGYQGVSREDCEKLLAFLDNFGGKLPWDSDIKKY